MIWRWFAQVSWTNTASGCSCRESRILSGPDSICPPVAWRGCPRKPDPMFFVSNANIIRAASSVHKEAVLYTESDLAALLRRPSTSGHIPIRLEFEVFPRPRQLQLRLWQSGSKAAIEKPGAFAHLRIFTFSDCEPRDGTPASSPASPPTPCPTCPGLAPGDTPGALHSLLCNQHSEFSRTHFYRESLPTEAC